MEGFKVDCLSSKMCEVLQQEAFDNGIKWCDGKTEVEQNRRYLYVDDKGSMTQTEANAVGRSCFLAGSDSKETVSIEEFIKRCEKYGKANREEKFTIGEYDVTLHNSGDLTVGCTTLEKDNVLKMISKYNEFNNK